MLEPGRGARGSGPRGAAGEGLGEGGGAQPARGSRGRRTPPCARSDGACFLPWGWLGSPLRLPREEGLCGTSPKEVRGKTRKEPTGKVKCEAFLRSGLITEARQLDLGERASSAGSGRSPPPLRGPVACWWLSGGPCPASPEPWPPGMLCFVRSDLGQRSASGLPATVGCSETAATPRERASAQGSSALPVGNMCPWRVLCPGSRGGSPPPPGGSPGHHRVGKHTPPLPRHPSARQL